MGNFISIPILAIAAALQASLVPQIRLLGGGPDFILLIVLSWALNSQLEEAVFWAFAGGIMQDLLSAAPTGTSALGMILLVFAISGIGQQVYRTGFVLLIGTVLAGTIVHQFIQMIILALIGYNVDWLTSIGFVVAPTIFYNLVMIWPVYWFIRRLQKRIRADARPSIRT